MKDYTHCGKLTNITIPKNIKKIHNFCFTDCKLLKNIYYEETLEYIAWTAFYNCGYRERLITIVQNNGRNTNERNTNERNINERNINMRNTNERNINGRNINERNINERNINNQLFKFLLSGLLLYILYYLMF